MCLSRYLYMCDEIIYSFLESLLKQKDLNECYYWISEYYYSGLSKSVVNILWKIYYDFYAIKYPKLESIIRDEVTQWSKTQDIIFILNIVANLFDCCPCSDVFLARESLQEGKSFRGRPPLWVKNFPPKYKNLLLCIHTCRYNQLMSHIKTMSSEELYQLVRRYFAEVKKMPLRENKLKYISYSNKHHIILALILHLQLPEEAIVLENDPITVPGEIVEACKQMNKDTINPLYRTLLHKRLYSISDSIGCFSLVRFSSGYPAVKKILRRHWEYYASFTPLWKKRFADYHAKREHKTRSMLFENDDYLESFGELYNYEPDEQNGDVQAKSTLEIKRITPREWIKNIFGVDCDRDQEFENYIKKKD